MKCKNCKCELSNASPKSFNDWHVSVEGNPSNVCACGCKEADSGCDICEWCGQRYPHGAEVYFSVVVFEEKHIICEQCKKHLKKEVNPL